MLTKCLTYIQKLQYSRHRIFYIFHYIEVHASILILLFFKLIRQHSLYSLVHDSSDELKMCLTRKKDWHSRVFFYFFLRHAKKSRIFITKSVVFLSKMGKILKKCPIRKKNLTYEIFFLLQHGCKTRRDSWTKEYSECCLYCWSSVKMKKVTEYYSYGFDYYRMEIITSTMYQMPSMHIIVGTVKHLIFARTSFCKFVT